ncbi:hypothetical protein FKW77_005268 [Venturia effusa]|uniref:Uncharacterized protein n=1 Tax=Venturia effusa TaxID=50376 RepID=A0A517L1B8_9PEZI|nr:hypothetical protein FKW77_005268 [Venturia effusa]
MAWNSVIHLKWKSLVLLISTKTICYILILVDLRNTKCLDLVKRHEETIHADRRRALGRAVPVPVQVPTPPSDEGSHFDSADHDLQYVDSEVAFGSEVQLLPAFDSGPSTYLDHNFGTVHDHEPNESFPDYAIDPDLDLLQFTLDRNDMTGFSPQPYQSNFQHQHEQPRVFDARPVKRMRQSESLYVQPAAVLEAPDLGSGQQISPDLFAVTAEDWNYHCLDIGVFTALDPSLPTTFG